jgi:hypothetical protein
MSLSVSLTARTTRGSASTEQGTAKVEDHRPLLTSCDPCACARSPHCIFIPPLPKPPIVKYSTNTCNMAGTPQAASANTLYSATTYTPSWQRIANTPTRPLMDGAPPAPWQHPTPIHLVTVQLLLLLPPQFTWSRSCMRTPPPASQGCQPPPSPGSAPHARV